MNPGNYFIKFETLEGKQYHIRELSEMITDYSPAGEYQGAWAFVTVTGVQVLDESFRSVSEPQVDDETQFYLRVQESDSSAGPAETISLFIVDNGADDTTQIDVVVSRVGVTNTYLGPFVLGPDASDTPLEMNGPTTLVKTVAPAGSRRSVKAGKRQLQMQKQNKVISTIPQNTPFQLSLKTDTTASGHQPNLLLADGLDSTQVTATLVTSRGKPFNAPIPVSLAVGPGEGSIENFTVGGDAVCRYSFTYRAPSKPIDLHETLVYRPVFYATMIFRPYANPVVGLSFSDGGWTPRYQWPMYYRGHSFKDIMTDFEFQSPGSFLPSEATVQNFLANVPTDTGTNLPSFLQNFYFVNMPDPPPGSTIDPPAWLPVDGFVDQNGNQTYDIGEPRYCANHSACLSLGFVTSVNRFSHVLFDMSQRFGISAANLITTLQKEQHFAQAGMQIGALPPTELGGPSGPPALDAALGCGLTLGDPPRGFIPQLRCAAKSLRDNFSLDETQSLDFFPGRPGQVDPDTTPQIASVCGPPGDQRVSVAYQSATKGSRAQAKYTNTVINCSDAGTYSFAYWWHYFFGGPP